MDRTVTIPWEIWLALRVLTDAALQLLEERQELPLPGAQPIVAVPGARVERLQRAMLDLVLLMEDVPPPHEA